MIGIEVNHWKYSKDYMPAINYRYFWAVGVILFLEIAAWSQPTGFLPGQRVLLDAHNCYPYAGQWMDRIDQALSGGLPIGIEIDLVADTNTPGPPRLVVSHGGRAKGNEPALRDYFFEKIRPRIEKALQEGNNGQWPLITLNINDLRTDEAAFFPALWNLMGEYETWLCTAPKTESLRRISPLEVKPVLVLTSDGPHQVKTFYHDLPVGGRLRLFASGKPDQDADNFRRWLNYSWREVEPEGQNKAADWSLEDAARLKSLVENAHRRGYWIRFYTLNGHSLPEAALRGWTLSYNFGSLEAAKIRWQAARQAGVDFVASDLYEECAKVLRN